MSEHDHRLSKRLWRAVRRKVLDARGWRCSRCGTARRLEVHHRTALVDGGAAYDPANLVILCRFCHLEEHHPKHPEKTAWKDLLSSR